MSKVKTMKLLSVLSIIVLVSIIALAKPVSAVSSPAFSNWFWNGDTNATGVIVADANNDNQVDVVIGGYYNSGTGWNSQLHVLNGLTYATQNVGSWNWGPNSQITSVAVGDVNGDLKNEIVTGGTYYDGTTWRSLVSVQFCSAPGAAVTTINIGGWLYGTSSEVTSVAIGDLYGDGNKEIVAGGSFFDGTRWNSVVDVFTCSTTTTALNLQATSSWFWGSGSQINSIAIGDVNADTKNEVVAGGQFFDGTRNNALLHVLSLTTGATSLAVLNYGSWFWTGDTMINSVTIADVAPTTGRLGIITGGSFFDGSRQNAMLHIITANAADAFVTVQQSGYWVWTGATTINSVIAGSFTGNPTLDIVTAGAYFDGSRYVAQLMDLNSANLAQRSVTTWFTSSNTVLNSVAIASTTLGIRVNAVGSYFDGTRSVAQLTVWA
jgi:hypothetical protein